MIEIGSLWAKGEILEDKTVLLFLPLHKFKMDKIDSIEDIFYYFCKNKENALIYKNHFISNNGQGLVIMLDGLDENVEAMQNDSFLYRTLIEEKIFSKACVIITSRPHATVGLQMYASCRVEIIGFTDNIRCQFVKSNLEENAKDLARGLS